LALTTLSVDAAIRMGLGYKCLGLVKLGFLGRFYKLEGRFLGAT
jgi:hypothetical protein